MNKFLLGSALLSILPPTCNTQSLNPYPKSQLIILIGLLVLALIFKILKKAKTKNDSTNDECSNVDNPLYLKVNTISKLGLTFSRLGIRIEAGLGALVIVCFLVLDKVIKTILILSGIAVVLVLIGFVLTITSIILYKKGNPTNKQLPKKIKARVNKSIAIALFLLLCYLYALILY